MSKLHDLITKLCPGGVQYKKLDEVSEIKRGRRVVKKELSQDSNSGYPVYQNSLKPLGYHTCSNEKAGTPFVIAAGSAGEIGYSDVDYWGADDCYSIECDDNTVNGRYIYHVLLLKQGRIKSQVRRASIPRLSSTAIKHLEIPVPPIEIQHEVVRILDTFTELEAELEAELADRIEQYEYYRDHLLNKKNLERMDGKPVEEKKLGDLADIGTGSSNTQDQEPDGIYPFYVRSPEVKRSNRFEFDETAVITAGDGEVGKIFHFVEGKYALHQRAFRVKPTDSSLDTKFLFYYMKANFRAYVERKACSATVKSLRKPMFINFEIPVPSLATQDHVVDILNRFDTLTTSLTEGIPAEIAMRREQYEYYRSRLLDFPRLPEDSDSDNE